MQSNDSVSSMLEPSMLESSQSSALTLVLRHLKHCCSAAVVTAIASSSHAGSVTQLSQSLLPTPHTPHWHSLMTLTLVTVSSQLIATYPRTRCHKEPAAPRTLVCSTFPTT